jgi:glycosyltransferase involved in cell wall biosynthesis
MTPVVSLVSPRVDHDVLAWGRAFTTLGYEVRSVDGSNHREINGDVVVVHDPAGLGSHLAALTDALRLTEARVIVRHRDLPWQRRELGDIDLEPLRTLDGAWHATPNLRSRRELEARGFERVVCIQDCFDLDPSPGDRHATRTSLGFDPDDIVVLQPTTGHERKNIAGAVRYVNELSTFIRNRRLRLWIKGPIHDGFRATFDKLRERCLVDITIGAAPSAADAYAATDVVIFPAAWDCSGDVVFEAIAHRRPCVTSDYPVLAELIAGGIRVLPIDEPAALVKFLAQSESARQRNLDATARRARVSFSIDDLPSRLAALLDEVVA